MYIFYIKYIYVDLCLEERNVEKSEILNPFVSLKESFDIN